MMLHLRHSRRTEVAGEPQPPAFGQTRRVVYVDDADLETPIPMTPSSESVAFRTVPIASLGRLVA